MTIDGEFAPTDLMLQLGELAEFAAGEAAAAHWLDAFLLVTAIGQVLEDELGRSRGAFDRVAEVTGGNRPVQAVALTAARVVRAAQRVRRRALAEPRDEAVALSAELAAAHLAGIVATDSRAETLRRRTADLAESPVMSALGDRAMRPPSCFRSFDQHPSDVVALVDAFAATTDPDRAVLVVGVRTSGSYLGAIAAASLRGRGFGSVDFITVRPGERLDRRQRRAVERLAGGGTMLVLDDPPVSGDAVARVAADVRRIDAVSDVVMLLSTDDPAGALPPALESYRRHVLTPEQWELHRRLTTDYVVETAAALLGDGAELRDAKELQRSDHSASGREHLCVSVSALLEDGGDERRVLVIAECVGIGFLGRHAVATAHALGDRAPRILGFRDGVLFQMAETAAEPAPVEVLGGPAEIARYAAARNRALGTSGDRSMAIRGHQAVWEVAAELVGRAGGRLDLPLRLPVVNPAVRAMLAVDSPSVIDGRMSGDLWVASPDGLAKLDFAEGATSNRDLASYDAAFDVASAFAPSADRDAVNAARRSFEDESGDRIAASRWVLLRLVHAWDQRRSGTIDGNGWDTEVSRALTDFVGETMLDLPADDPRTGALVAVDVDGVLETGVLGGSAAGLAGATALRALVAHGYRVVPATGRGAAEVRHRVDAYGLAGGVAEYGAALVVPELETIDARDAPGRAAMETLREWLADRDDVFVDPSHRYGVRARRRRAAGRAIGSLPDALVREAVDAAGGADAITVVDGDDQTDFVPRGVDKGTGLAALIALLAPAASSGQDRPLAMAVGDGVADEPMLSMAGLAIVPAHARGLAEATGAQVARHAYQAGLADAAERLLGHAAGSCPVCAPRLADADRVLLRLLSLREAGSAGILARVAGAAWDARRFVRRQRAATTS